MTVMLLSGSITLNWQHSIEKTHWQESYQLSEGQLRLTHASVQGSGAGMEPPPEAVLRNGAWHWQPDITLDQLTLASSEFTAEYTLCTDPESCFPLSHWVPQGSSVTLLACVDVEETEY
ncbi:MAG: DUF1850 domain-containing protein [Oceanisphaera sp.]|uniref:DUF1850 domain-containing protein n=1 Tax=Oceanisphaera sp. TaxID=1929979 RepID=UPI003F983F47